MQAKKPAAQENDEAMAMEVCLQDMSSQLALLDSCLAPCTAPNHV